VAFVYSEIEFTKVVTEMSFLRVCFGIYINYQSYSNNQFYILGISSYYTSISFSTSQPGEHYVAD